MGDVGFSAVVDIRGAIHDSGRQPAAMVRIESEALELEMAASLLPAGEPVPTPERCVRAIAHPPPPTDPKASPPSPPPLLRGSGRAIAYNLPVLFPPTGLQCDSSPLPQGSSSSSDSPPDSGNPDAVSDVGRADPNHVGYLHPTPERWSYLPRRAYVWPDISPDPEA